jgi:hypothetical protein
MLGQPKVDIMAVQDNIALLRPEPLTDLKLEPSCQSANLGWHGNKISYIPGLNYLSDLFLIWHDSQQRHNQTIPQLQSHIAQLQRALDSLPAPLRWRGGLSRPPGSNFGTDVQIANLYITQLHIHSNLLEQRQRLSTTQCVPENEKVTVVEERQRIVDDLLEILYHMPPEVFEANGFSLLPKSRDIGAGLLTHLEVGAENNTGQIIGGKARQNLTRLLERLEMLEFIPSVSGLTP